VVILNGMRLLGRMPPTSGAAAADGAILRRRYGLEADEHAGHAH
jgi:hypothetical protein